LHRNSLQEMNRTSTINATETKRDPHPVASLFPALDEPALVELAADIATHGLREPIWLHRDGRILDGRNRNAACDLAGIEPTYRTWEGDENDLVAFVVSLNLHRRHLSESQRAMVAAKIATLDVGSNQHASIEAPSQADAAKMLNVGRASVQRAKRVLTFAPPDVVKAVEQGEVAVSAAVRQLPSNAGKPTPQQEPRKAIRDAAMSFDFSAVESSFAITRMLRHRGVTVPDEDAVHLNIANAILAAIHHELDSLASRGDIIVPEKLNKRALTIDQAYRDLQRTRSTTSAAPPRTRTTPTSAKEYSDLMKARRQAAKQLLQGSAT
jgi:hypothetical protein